MGWAEQNKMVSEICGLDWCVWTGISHKYIKKKSFLNGKAIRKFTLYWKPCSVALDTQSKTVTLHLSFISESRPDFNSGCCHGHLYSSLHEMCWVTHYMYIQIDIAYIWNNKFGQKTINWIEKWSVFDRRWCKGN